MYKCLPHFALALLVFAWAIFRHAILEPSLPETTPTAGAAATPPAVPVAQPEIVGTAIVNGIEIRFEAPRNAVPPAATATPPTVTARPSVVDRWINMRAAWAGMASAMFGPVAVVFAVLFFALGLAGWRRLANARA